MNSGWRVPYPEDKTVGRTVDVVEEGTVPLAVVVPPLASYTI
jgi:hypothetical protein